MFVQDRWIFFGSVQERCLHCLRGDLKFEARSQGYICPTFFSALSESSFLSAWRSQGRCFSEKNSRRLLSEIRRCSSRKWPNKFLRPRRSRKQKPAARLPPDRRFRILLLADICGHCRLIPISMRAGIHSEFSILGI